MNMNRLVPLLLVFSFVFVVVGCGSSSTTSTTTLVGLNSDVVIDPPSVVLTVQGMSCPLCANNIDRSLLKIPGITSAKIDLGAGTVLVTLAPGSRVRQADLQRAIDDAGYTLQSIEVPGKEPAR
jgi:copper chaperone CopZ